MMRVMRVSEKVNCKILFMANVLKVERKGKVLNFNGIWRVLLCGRDNYIVIIIMYSGNLR